jgi:hypothetical protein
VGDVDVWAKAKHAHINNGRKLNRIAVLDGGLLEIIPNVLVRAHVFNALSS